MRISDWSSDVCSSDLQRVHEEAERQLSRLDEIAEKVDDPKIERAREKIDQALAASTDDGNPEKSKEAMDRVQEAKKLLAKIRGANLKPIRQIGRATSELQSLMRISYAVFCLKKKTNKHSSVKNRD